ncbi:MAG TPA: hypothetical protein DCS93_32940 [Microscillaceae bacterium]|nr:hypothetical protein [Microscillaceae bacterium]
MGSCRKPKKVSKPLLNKRWPRQYENLRSLKKEQGHLKPLKNTTLISWVFHQRGLYKKR